MSLSEEERILLVQMQLEKSDKIMQEALVVSEMGYWNLVANRVYYSVFHAVAGLFINDGFDVHTHKGAATVFGQKYILTGTLDAKWGKLYSKLQSLREKCDYNVIYETSEAEMRPIIKESKEMISAIKEYIQNTDNS